MTSAFHSYLEEKGVISRLVKILVSLFEMNEKPENPLLFMRDELSKILVDDLSEVAPVEKIENNPDKS